MERDSLIPLDNSSQDSSFSTEADGERKDSFDWGPHKKRSAKKKESLRIEELKRDWTRLLEESRDHRDAPDAESKRADWLQKVESIYDEYSTLSTLDP